MIPSAQQAIPKRGKPSGDSKKEPPLGFVICLTFLRRFIARIFATFGGIFALGTRHHKGVLRQAKQAQKIIALTIGAEPGNFFVTFVMSTQWLDNVHFQIGHIAAQQFQLATAR